MTMFLAPYTAIADIDGSPLDAGFLFFGEYEKDPELFPVEVFWDSEFTVPAAQPIRTRNGYPVRNGSPTKVYLKTAQHSIVIKNRNGAFILVDFKNKGWDASFVVDASGKTQQEVNDGVESIAALRLLKPKQAGERVYLVSANLGQGEGGGVFISTQKAGLVDDGGIIISSATNGIFYERINYDFITPEMFGHARNTDASAVMRKALEASVKFSKEVVVINPTKINETIYQTEGSSITCRGGLIYCDDPTNLTNKTVWVVDTGEPLAVTSIGDIIISTAPSTTSYVDLDIIGIVINKARFTANIILTFGCAGGGVVNNSGYEIHINLISCRISRWTDIDVWGVDFSGQDAILGTIVVTGYARGAKVGSTSHVTDIHVWGLPATVDNEYAGRQMLTGVQIGANTHVDMLYLDTIDTNTYTTPADFSTNVGVNLIFAGFNSSVNKVYVLCHVQSAKNKAKLVKFLNTQNTIGQLTVGDDSFIDRTNAVFYSKPRYKWANSIVDGNVTYFTNKFTYPVSDLIAGGQFDGSLEVTKADNNSIFLQLSVLVVNQNITDTSFRMLLPDSLNLSSLSPNVYQHTMFLLSTGDTSVSALINGAYIQFVKINATTGNYEFILPSAVRGGRLTMSAIAYNTTPKY